MEMQKIALAALLAAALTGCSNKSVGWKNDSAKADVPIKIEKEADGEYASYGAMKEAFTPDFSLKYIEEDEVKSESFKDIQCRIDVPPSYFYLGRQTIDAKFNPVYFNPSLLDQPHLFINFIKRGVTHTYPDNAGLKYTLKFYSNDYDDSVVDVLAIVQLRLRDNKNLIMNIILK